MSNRNWTQRAHRTVLVGLLLLLIAPRATALDRVKPHTGSASTGKITEITATEVTIELGITRKKLPVSEIESVSFENEPADLAKARTAIQAGHWQEAQAVLAKIDLGAITRDEIKDEVEFYSALAACEMALGWHGSLLDAGKKMQAFERAHKNSYHYFQSCEVMGDVLAALGRFDQPDKPGAESYYEKVSSAPWPEYKMRVDLSLGRALVGAKKYDEAMQKFDEVQAGKAVGKDADLLRLAARLGKLAAKSMTGDVTATILSLQEFIANTDAENYELQARAYNILGNAYKRAGKKKEALNSFLHVDLLYSKFPDQHAEALSNLATLFPDERAARARFTLKEKYPDCPLAKQ